MQEHDSMQFYCRNIICSIGTMVKNVTSVRHCSQAPLLHVGRDCRSLFLSNVSGNHPGYLGVSGGDLTT